MAQDDERLLRALGTELIRLSRRRTAVPPDAWLEASAFRILWVLVSEGAATMQELGEALQLEQSTVSRQVKHAIERDLVERYLPEGESLRRLRATTAGREAYTHDVQLRGRAILAALSSLGPERAEQLVSDLRLLNDELEIAYDAPS